MNRQMWGADVEALDHLANRFEVSANRLNGLARQLSAQLGHAPWHGAGADRFRADWNRSYRGQLNGASNFLTYAASAVRRQAHQQREASGAGGVDRRGISGRVPGFAAFMAAVRSVSTRVTEWGVASDSLSRAVGLIDTFSENRYSTGDYTKTWHGILRAADSAGVPQDFLRFKRSEFFHAVRPLHHIVHPAGVAFSAFTFGAAALSIPTEVRQEHYFDATLIVGDTASSALKAKGAYLPGAALQTWTEVARAAHGADWSAQGLKAIRDASLKDWGGAFADSVTKTMPGVLVNIFSP